LPITTLACFYTTNYIIRPYSAVYRKLQTRSCAPEEGRNYRPKHVELIETANKIIIVVSSWLFILLLSMMHGHTNIKS